MAIFLTSEKKKVGASCRFLVGCAVLGTFLGGAHVNAQISHTATGKTTYFGAPGETSPFAFGWQNRLTRGQSAAHASSASGDKKSAGIYRGAATNQRATVQALARTGVLSTGSWANRAAPSAIAVASTGYTFRSPLAPGLYKFLDARGKVTYSDSTSGSSGAGAAPNPPLLGAPVVPNKPPVVVAPTPGPVATAPGPVVTPRPTPVPPFVTPKPAPVPPAVTPKPVPVPPVVTPKPVPVPPVVTPTPVPVPPVVAPLPANSKTIESFGAVGNGTTDDQAAIQRALDSLKAGDNLVLAAGKTYRHSDVLNVRVPGVRISGPGTLLATNEGRSSFHIGAENVTLDGVVFRISGTTRRWEANEQHRVRLSSKGTIVRNIVIEGSASGGIFLSNGASNFLIEDVEVKNTRADAIHNTEGVHDGVIRRATVRNPGDDGIAVVSYGGQPVICRNIRIESPRYYGGPNGRGFSVVGGENITFTDVYAESSNAGAVYIAAEGYPYYTYAAKNIKVLGGELRNSNTNASVDHGAVLVYSGRSGYTNDDIEIADLRINNTRASASWQVGILGGANRVVLRNLVFSGGPSNKFATDQPADKYTLAGWTR